MKEVQNIHGLLKVEWTTVPRDLEKCGGLLSKLKVALTGLTFLPATIDAEVSSVVCALVLHEYFFSISLHLWSIVAHIFLFPPLLLWSVRNFK